MKIDVSKLMDLEYLKECISQINGDIEKIKTGFLEEYTLEHLKAMSSEELNSLFQKYDLSNVYIVQYFGDDYIDEEWEFADLFEDDISYSLGQRDELKKKALEELSNLNKKIALINENSAKEIFNLEGKLALIKCLLDTLSDNDITQEEVNNLSIVLLNSGLTEEEIYKFSFDLTKKIIDKKKKQQIKKEEDTSLFEQTLEDAYESSNYKDVENENIEQPTYNETVLTYYKYYKKLFDKLWLGASLLEILNDAYELSNEMDLNVNSISEEDFCIELGATLYKLNEALKKDRTDQTMLSNLLMDLSAFDKIYEENLKLVESKEKLLADMEDSLSLLLAIHIKSSYINGVKNRLNLLIIELKNNLINFERNVEINESYKKIQKDMKKITELVKQIRRLTKLYDNVTNKIKVNYADSRNFVDGHYEELCAFQTKVSDFIKFIEDNDYDLKNNDYIDELYNEYRNFNSEKKKVDNKTKLKGFVLFDFDNNNIPYVVSDMDPNNSKNFIDSSLEKKKVRIAYDDYSKLIKDLLLFGEPEIISLNNKTATLILDKVYVDKERNHPTNMVRIKPTRNSSARFMSEKIYLRSDMKIFEQVCQIIEEILPNITIDRNEDFCIYINYCSAIKRSSDDSYVAAINRYAKKSPLQRLFSSINNDSKLSDEECSLLKDIINMSLDAYTSLKQKNPNIKCEIVNQIGGGRARG